MDAQPRLQELEVKIINVVPDPIMQDRAIVTVEFNDGTYQWQKSVTIHDSKTRVNPEDVIQMVKDKFNALNLHRPLHFFADVEQAAKDKQVYKIIVDKT